MVGCSRQPALNHMNKKIEIKFGEITAERAALPFYGQVADLTYPQLLKLRIAVRERCITDLDFRDDINRMCAVDVAFFAAMFAVFHETRATEEQLGAFPVYLDPDQADILACLQKYGGLTDMVIEKSRGIGLSYLVCVYALWVWMYKKGGLLDIAFLSKDETALDMPRRPSSLFGKLDLLFENLPTWMKVMPSGKPLLKRTITDHRFENLSNGNAILGFVPTNDKLRSGRYLFLIADESAFLPFDTQRWLASTHGVTFSVIFVSTHDGTNNLFYRLTQNSVPKLVRVSSWWWDNRRCRRGLYKSVHGQIEVLDKSFKFPLDYKFYHEHDPLLRSPWVDRCFERPEADAQTVLQELYGVAVVNMRKLFQPAVMDTVKKSLLGPVWLGTWADGEFQEMFDRESPIWTFKPVDMLGSRFVIGCDPSHGLPGKAYGGLAVIETVTGEHVLSGFMPNCDAADLAGISVQLSKYLGSVSGRGRCRIAYESQGGVGGGFKAELARLGFPEPMSLAVPNRDRGETLLIELSRAIRDGDVVIRDSRIADELENFVYSNTYQLEYAGKDGHGDATIALSLAWQLAKAVLTPPLERVGRRHPGEREEKTRHQKKIASIWSSQFLVKR